MHNGLRLFSIVLYFHTYLYSAGGRAVMMRGSISVVSDTFTSYERDGRDRKYFYSLRVFTSPDSSVCYDCTAGHVRNPQLYIHWVWIPWTRDFGWDEMSVFVWFFSRFSAALLVSAKLDISKLWENSELHGHDDNSGVEINSFDKLQTANHGITPAWHENGFSVLVTDTRDDLRIELPTCSSSYSCPKIIRAEIIDQLVD